MRQAHIVPNKKGCQLFCFCPDIGMKQTFSSGTCVCLLGMEECYWSMEKKQIFSPANWMKTCEVWPGWWQKVKYRLSEPPIWASLLPQSISVETHNIVRGIGRKKQSQILPCLSIFCTWTQTMLLSFKLGSLPVRGSTKGTTWHSSFWGGCQKPWKCRFSV